MITPVIFDMSQTQLTETDNNAFFKNSSVEQNVLLQKPLIVMYSPSSNSFYTVGLPDISSLDDQVVGIFNDG